MLFHDLDVFFSQPLCELGGTPYIAEEKMDCARGKLRIGCLWGQRCLKCCKEVSGLRAVGICSREPYELFLLVEGNSQWPAERFGQLLGGAHLIPLKFADGNGAHPTRCASLSWVRSSPRRRWRSHFPKEWISSMLSLPSLQQRIAFLIGDYIEKRLTSMRYVGFNDCNTMRRKP